MRFSTKLTLLFSFIIITMGALASYFVYKSNINFIEGSVERQLNDHAFDSMDKLERLLYEKYADIKYLAVVPTLTSRESTPEEIAEKLNAYRKSNSTYASLSFFTLDRIRVADTAGRDLGKKHSFSEYWPGISQGKDFVLNISFSESLESNVFHFAHIVKDRSGVPLGVVVARVHVDTILDIINSTSRDIDSSRIQIDLVDRDGLILYSNYNRAGVLKDTLYDWEKVKRVLGSGPKFGVIKHSASDAENEIAAFSREQGYLDFKGNGWTLVMDLPTEVAFAPAVKLRDRMVFIFAFFGVFGLLVIYLFSRKVSGPLKRLNEAAFHVGMGNLNINVESSTNDEIGQLAYSFNRMVNRLKESREKLLCYSNELEESKKSLLEAQRIARLGNWELDVGTNEVVWSQEVFRIFQQDPAVYRPSFQEFVELIHYEDRDFFKGVIEGAMNGGRKFSADFRVILPDGKERIFYSKGEVTFDDARNPLRVTGTVQDITERKRTEDQLAIFRKFAEVSAQGFGMTTLGGEIIYVNPTLCRLLGEMHGEAAFGEDLMSYRPADVLQKFGEEILPRVREGGEWTGELVIAARDGKVVQTIESFNLIKDEKGHPLYIAIVVTDNTERKMMEEELKRLATVDRLTQAYNRLKFDEIIKKEIKRATRTGKSLSLSVFDIDHFKSVNDRFGHGAGDSVIRTIAEIVQKNIRETDYLIRWGGEEFILVIPGCGSSEAAIQIDRIRSIIEDHAFEGVGSVTVSFGVAQYAEGDTDETLCKRADDALYAAKSKGRNRVEMCA